MSPPKASVDDTGAEQAAPALQAPPIASPPAMASGLPPPPAAGKQRPEPAAGEDSAPMSFFRDSGGLKQRSSAAVGRAGAAAAGLEKVAAGQNG